MIYSLLRKYLNKKDSGINKDTVIVRGINEIFSDLYKTSSFDISAVRYESLTYFSLRHIIPFSKFRIFELLTSLLEKLGVVLMDTNLPVLVVVLTFIQFK